MEHRDCPICGWPDIPQVEMTIGGTTDLYWVCPEGDYEYPVNLPRAAQAETPSES